VSDADDDPCDCERNEPVTTIPKVWIILNDRWYKIETDWFPFRSGDEECWLLSFGNGAKRMLAMSRYTLEEAIERFVADLAKCRGRGLRYKRRERSEP